jgi:tol-pal system protein YbgF
LNAPSTSGSLPVTSSTVQVAGQGSLNPSLNQPVQQQVEQRVITAPPIDRTTESTATPVEERVLGGPTTNSISIPSNSQPLVTNSVGSAGAVTEGALATATVQESGGALPQPVFDSRNPQTANEAGLQASLPNPVANSVPQAAVTASSVQNAVPANGVPEQQMYDQGFSLLKEGKYDDANIVFERQISVHPNGGLADDARYWIAESHYVNRNLDSSKQQFKTIIKNYPDSPRIPDAMLKTAYIEQEQGNVIEARILLQEIVQYHPRSNAAISAKNRLAELN